MTDREKRTFAYASSNGAGTLIDYGLFTMGDDIPKEILELEQNWKKYPNRVSISSESPVFNQTGK